MRTRDVVRAATRIGRAAARDVADWVWPQTCGACGADSEGLYSFVCDACRHELVVSYLQPACVRCGMPKLENVACSLCIHSRANPLLRMCRLADYKPPASRLVTAMKFGGRWDLCEPVGVFLATVSGIWPDESVVVPVPLHRSRRVSRGYDQARLIARGFAKVLGYSCVDALRRIRPTLPQTSVIGRQNRVKNLLDAFAPVPRHVPLLRYKHVILIDDVTTTGSTLHAAASALYEAEAACVSAAVVALATGEEDLAFYNI